MGHARTVRAHRPISPAPARAQVQIAKTYICGFFLIDIFSIMPFYMTTFYLTPGPVECNLFNGQVGIEVASGQADGEAAFNQATQSLKLLKLLRIFKLARVVKASRVLKRLLQDLLMTKFEMTFASLKVMQLFTGVVFLAHWQAVRAAAHAPPPNLFSQPEYIRVVSMLTHHHHHHGVLAVRLGAAISHVRARSRAPRWDHPQAHVD